MYGWNADSTSQYDAIRAYLKELDITENIWIGLSKTNEKPNFSWTDFQPLSGEGHWQQAIPVATEPLCVAMDPAADFLWKPLPCGGPEVASFICELPVPSWAIGPRGCLLTELPSLTVLYIPEQLALELTSDCGLDGTKRIACKGNADREEILKQLTCAISNDDFDEKSTKPSIPTSTFTSESVSDENSINSKTTKPWIWTSNTIDIDYGMPTRHRRETENTESPLSTKTTTNLPINNRKLIKPTTISLNYEVTSLSPKGDVTLDSSIRSDKSIELKATQIVDFTTQEPNTEQEEQAEIDETATTESKTVDLAGNEDTAEYPSAINQGQLFSIIENGTMFDIIELNETGTDDAKFAKDEQNTASLLSKITATATSTTTITQRDNLYTTVVYHKEPPTELNFVTNKSVKKMDKQQNKKKAINIGDDLKKNPIITKSLNNQTKNLTNESITNEDDKSLMKEVEMFPIMTNSLVKLNRTNRKELPKQDDEMDDNSDEYGLDKGSNYGVPEILNFSINNHLNYEETHQHVEIKLYKDGNQTNPLNTFTVTTKRNNNKLIKKSEDNIEKFESSNNEEIQPNNSIIDPKIGLLNNFTYNENNNESETFIKNSDKIQSIPDESMLMKEQFLPKSLLGEENTETTTVNLVTSSDEPLEPEPRAQPRPNRQRQLTRPQRRSFYPYFFSRVLG